MGNNYDFANLIEIARQAYKKAEINGLPTTPTIQVVIVEPYKKPYIEQIANDLGKFNDIVGGYFEKIFIATNREREIGLIVNNEGRLLKLPFNRRLFGHTGLFDILVGTIIITAYDRHGENTSLTDQEAKQYIKRFTPIEVYI